MKVVTQNIKIELENDEKLALSTASCILRNFMNIMRNHNCCNAYFEQIGVEYNMRELGDAVDLLETFNEENPTIE